MEAVPPFDFDLSARIFSDGDKQVRKYENGRFWQVIRVGSKLVLVIVRASGTVDKPKLVAELKSKELLSQSDTKKTGEIVRMIFNLEFDLNQFYRQTRNDIIMASITRKLRGLKGPGTPTVYEALVDSITEQQISLDVANILETKLIKTFGETLSLGKNVYYAYPTPQRLALASIEELRMRGLSSKKAEYIKEVSKLIAEGKLDLEKFKDYEDTGEIIDKLDEIRGIGVWTAELTIVRGMQRLEAFPAEDLGLRRVISHFYCGNRKISTEEARAIAEKWGKWKGLAGFYLIVAERMEKADV